MTKIDIQPATPAYSVHVEVADERVAYAGAGAHGGRKGRSGQYRTASEVVREGLRLLAQRDEEYQVKLAALRAEIQKGKDAIARGEGIPAEEAFARIRSLFREGIGSGQK